MTGADLPQLLTAVPGPHSQRRIDLLAKHECPAITARRDRRAALLGAASDDPIVWRAAVGANVEDVDGNRFIDLTSGFGVAFVGHRHPTIVRAAAEQAELLVHGMGDAFPDAARINLCETLADIAPGDLSVSILGLSGSDAIDAARKTAVLATGKSGVVAFGAGYHGLASGVLDLQAYKPAFADPFRDTLPTTTRFVPFGCPMSALREALSDGTIGMVLVEPIQGRGGMLPAPDGWLAEVAAVAREAGALLAFDEIQCGLGRTGHWFASEHDRVTPDLLCLGKALGGGYPLSACLGTPEVMSAWGASKGEALHTQTFLGHPVGCAAALATLTLIDEAQLLDWAKAKGARLRAGLEELGLTVRGRGLMLGVSLPSSPLAISRALLKRGYITLPAGQQAEVLALTPPVCLTESQIDAFTGTLGDLLYGEGA